VLGGLRVRQPHAGTGPTRAWATAAGLARGARVHVEVGSDRAGEPGSIAGWLLPGRHPGVVLHARVRVGGTRVHGTRVDGARAAREAGR